MMKKYYICNILSIFLVIFSIFITTRLKGKNYRINSEVSYLNSKILEQKNDIKLLKAEHILVSSPQKLCEIYKQYNKRKAVKSANLFKIDYHKNIYNLKKFVSLYRDTKYSSNNIE